MPLVSVIMPVYNAQLYLAEAVESILNQTFSDFEFITIDDGSTDKSLKILQRYAALDDRIVLVSRRNTGIVGALNEGIAMARGEYIARMDADDVSMPSRLEQQIGYMAENPNCVAVGGLMLMVDPSGSPLMVWDIARTHEEIDRLHMSGHGGAMPHAASMLRRDALLSVGGYRAGVHAEDLDLFLRLAEIGELCNLPVVVYKYRQQFSSLCHTKRNLIWDSKWQAIRQACERRGVSMPEEGTMIRQSDDSRAATHRKWGWWAFESGFIWSALKHSIACLWRTPLSKKSWILFLCVLLKGKRERAIAESKKQMDSACMGN